MLCIASYVYTLQRLAMVISLKKKNHRWLNTINHNIPQVDTNGFILTIAYTCSHYFIIFYFKINKCQQLCATYRDNTIIGQGLHSISLSKHVKLYLHLSFLSLYTLYKTGPNACTIHHAHIFSSLVRNGHMFPLYVSSNIISTVWL